MLWDASIAVMLVLNFDLHILFFVRLIPLMSLFWANYYSGVYTVTISLQLVCLV